MKDEVLEKIETNYFNKKSGVKDFYEILESVIQSAVVLILIFTFVFRIMVVDGTSMYPTLNNKDILIVSDMFYTPKQGDIVISTQPIPGYGVSDPIVKRVIAVAGQTVDINDTTGTVFVDGKPLDEPYLSQQGITQSRTFEFPVTVPEGNVLIMGDNRRDSLDGRYFGFTDERYILGRVILRVFPFNKIGGVN